MKSLTVPITDLISPACTRKLDILIAVDASSSKCAATEPCPEWNAILQFCKDLVNSLTIGKDDTQVAFVTLTDEAKTEWNLAGYVDHDIWCSQNNLKVSCKSTGLHIRMVLG